MAYAKTNETEGGFFSDGILDVEEEFNQDAELKFSNVVYNIEMKIINCLTNPIIDVGLRQFQLLVNHLEIVCSANKKLPSLYAKTVAAKREEILLKNPTYTEGELETAIAHYKLSLMLIEIFAHGTIELALRNYEIAPPPFRRIALSDTEKDESIDVMDKGISELDYFEYLIRTGKLEKLQQQYDEMILERERTNGKKKENPSQ